jgi:hypothetical protein
MMSTRTCKICRVRDKPIANLDTNVLNDISLSNGMPTVGPIIYDAKGFGLYGCNTLLYRAVQERHAVAVNIL